MEGITASDLLGKRYIDPQDSGDQVMEVWSADYISPGTVVWVRPLGETQRAWWRSAAQIRLRVEAYEESQLAINVSTETEGHKNETE